MSRLGLAAALVTMTVSATASLGAQTKLHHASMTVDVSPHGVIVSADRSIETFGGPRVQLDGTVTEWCGVAFDGPNGHVEAAGHGRQPDWAHRPALRVLSVTSDAQKITSVAMAGDALRIETVLRFDAEGDYLLCGVTLTNLGRAVIRNVIYTREWDGAARSWSFPDDLAVPLPLRADVCRVAWKLDDLPAGGTAGTAFTYRPSRPDGAPAPVRGIDVPLAGWTSATWPGGLELGLTNGVSWGDYDADGYPDLFACMEGVLIRNQSGRDWGPVIDLNAVLPATGRRYGSAFGDYNQDGKPDLATAPRKGFGGDECLHVLRQDPVGTFFDIALDPNLLDVQACAADAETICWADVDGDGELDFFLPVYPAWAYSGLGNYFYYNEGPTGPGGAYRFTEQSAIAGLDNPIGTARPEGAQMLDTDGDGDVDLYSNGTLYLNESVPGKPRFTPLLSADTGIQYSSVLEEGIVFFDADLDGDQDLIGAWTTLTSGVRVHEALGDGSFAEMPSTTVSSHAVGLFLGISAADWDNDGDIDFTTRQIFRRNQLMETGQLQFTVASHLIPSWQLVNATPAWADWDKDGDLDCALGNWRNEGSFYQNTTYDPATPNHLRRHLRVRVMRDSPTVPRGTETEYGASVEVAVRGDRHRRVRFVSSSGGYLTQDEYVLHFALPPDPTPTDPLTDLILDVSVDLPDATVHGYQRVDRHVNPVLGGLPLARLADREIVVYRSGKVVMDGCLIQPATPVETALHTTTDGLVRPAPGQPLTKPTPADPTEFVGLAFDTIGAAEPVRITELLLDGELGDAAPCGTSTAGNLFLWDVTGGTPQLVSNGAISAQTSPRNDRSDLATDLLLAPDREFRLVAAVRRLRPTPMPPPPTAVGGVQVTGGVRFTDADPCSGAAAAAATVDATQVYLAFRYRSSRDGPSVDLGYGLPGDTTPTLRASGAARPATPITIDLSDAPPLAPTAWILGASAECTQLLGTVIVPAFDGIVDFLSTDEQGAASVTRSWPAAAGPGATLYIQVAVADAGAPLGVAFSNAIAVVGQP